jgi:small redox-active disulfide protein 2
MMRKNIKKYWFTAEAQRKVRLILFSGERPENKKAHYGCLYISALSAEIYNLHSLRPLRLCGENIFAKSLPCWETLSDRKGEWKMEIKVLGPGCPNCHKMEELAKTAVKELGTDATIEKVSDIAEIMRYTMSTPGLVVNGKLKHSGKPLPGLDRIKKLIGEEV